MFCLRDPFFYESPWRVRGDDPDFEVASRPTPVGWARRELDDWLVFQPPGDELPVQGWKIHASARLDTAEAIGAAVWDYCVPRAIAFKLIRSDALLFIRNSKSADRESSGKFVTIYPRDEAELEAILRELGCLLEGLAGPYILSDLRIGKGPLYVRYGAFVNRLCAAPNGEPVPAIEDDTGELVPDRRHATFVIPSWVALPDALMPHLAARNSQTVDEVPYRFERALHFSNSGGLYQGIDPRSGDTVVLKEARPHAGLSTDRADAIARLSNERDVLERLAGLDVVPGVRDYFVLGDHHFLVQDFVEGSTLHSQLVERFPLILPSADEDAIAEYAAWALEMCERIERAVAAVHGRGVVMGDLNASNILIRPNGSVVLVDWEVATLAVEEQRPSLGTPGFSPPRGLSGLDVDRYALACLRLFLFLPLTTLIRLDATAAERLGAEIARLYPLPTGFVSEAVDAIGRAEAASGDSRRVDTRLHPGRTLDPPDWQQARDAMVTAIVASATPGRQDRLFPGDVDQFAPGGELSLAYGAAGVLYALHAVGAGRYANYEDWLVRRAGERRSGTPLGLYNGLHGVAFVLDILGRRGDALEVLDRCLEEAKGRYQQLGLDLYGGLAGIGMSLAHFAAATDDAALWSTAKEVADQVAERLGSVNGTAEVSGGDHPYAGLVRGSSGAALLCIRLYERTGDRRLLDLAATALRQDLRRCIPVAGGALHVNEGWRTMPYLADGSVGIGMVVDDYLRHRWDEELATAADAIRAAASSPFYIQPGLFYGRAGMILFLSRRHRPAAAAVDDPVVSAQIRRLNWHAVEYRGGLAFPGDQLLRLSMDLSSGTAGVLLALGAALHDQPVGLPFLDPLSSDRTGRSDAAVLGSGIGELCV